MDNIDKFALNIAQRICEKAFFSNPPDIPEKAILYALAKNGTSSLVELVKTIGNYGDWEANHHTIKRKIDPEDKIGLIDYEFIKDRKPEVRRPGKYGKVYSLTTKGFLASLATGLTFERIDVFKKYIQFLDKMLSRKIKYIGSDSGFDSSLDKNTKQKMLDVITKYIKFQIIIFLIWHEANEISLRNKRNSNWYIEDFFIAHNEFVHLEFPSLIVESRKEEYKEILREYFTYSKILHGLDELVPDNEIGKKIRDNLQMISPFVFNWYLYFDELQMINPIGKPYDLNKIPSVVLSRPEYGIDIEYYGKSGNKKIIQPDIKNKVSDELKQILKQKTSIDKIWKNPHDKKRLTNPLEI